MFLVYVEQTGPYTVTVLAGILAALALGWYRCRRHNVPGVVWATVLLPVFGAFFAHLFYGLAKLDRVLEDASIWSVFAFWNGDYMLYGGMAGCLLALWLSGGKRGAARLMDAYAPSGALMIAAARIAEGFMGQGFGAYVEAETVLCRFPFMVFDADYEMWAWALFMLEALVALILFVILLSHKPRRPGDSALLLCGLYACAQIVMENMRWDDFLRWGFVRCAEVISAVAIAIVLLCYHRRAPRERRRARAICWAVYAAMIGLCMLMEFAADGKVPFLRFMDVYACHACMAAACVALMGCVLRMRGLDHGGTRNPSPSEMRAHPARP